MYREGNDENRLGVLAGDADPSIYTRVSRVIVFHGGKGRGL